MFGRGLRTLSIASLVLVTGAFALVFFYAPNDADQGFVQKIFYLHVPLAIVALCGFVAGGIFAIRYLRTGDRAHDLRSYVAIHLSLILGVGVLPPARSGPRRRGAHWWVWDEPTLVSFLIVFLLFACYQPLRFSIEDPERQARYAAVFAIIAGAFVPLNFLAVRLAPVAHPPARALDHDGGSMPGEMRADVPGLAGRDGVPVRDAVEVRAGLQARLDAAARAAAPRSAGDDAAGPARAQRRTRLAALMPALPLDDAGPYVAAAYLVFLALILVYVAIMASKLARIERELRRAAPTLVEHASAETVPEEDARGGAAMSELLALGASHKTAPRRGARAHRADRAGAERFLRELADEPAIAEAVALSTCNRTELYLVVGDPVEAESAVLGLLARRAGVRPTELARGHLLAAQLRRRAPSLPRHLRARVDGRRRGRGPGPGQARLRGRAGGAGDRPADQQAVPRRARDRQARAHARPRSPPAAPASPRSRSTLARDALGDLAARHVLIIGAGETAELTARALHDAGRRGRSSSPTAGASARLELAQRFGGGTVCVRRAARASSSAPTSSSPRPPRRTRSAGRRGARAR